MRLDIVKSDISERAQAFLADPRARTDWRGFYDAMYEVPAVEVGPAQWLLAGHDDVNRVMQDAGAALAALFPATSTPGLNGLFLGLLPYEQGANHARLRAIGRGLFTRESIACLQEQIAAMVEERVLPAAFEDGCDLHASLAVDLPKFTSAILLDVAQEDWDWLGEAATTMYRQLGRYDQADEELHRAEAALAALRDYVGRRAAGPDHASLGGVGNRLVDLFRAGALDEDELLHFFALFLFTGMDTLTHGINNAVWLLAGRPDLFARLRSDPRLANAAFDEALRLWGPIRLCIRQLEDPIALDRCKLPENATAFLLLHAANLDPRVIDDPHSFRWDRRANHRFAFGSGPHNCMGAAIGRAVGGGVFRTLVSRCASLTCGPVEGEVEFYPSLQILGVEAGPLRATAAVPF